MVSRPNGVITLQTGTAYSSNVSVSVAACPFHLRVAATKPRRKVHDHHVRQHNQEVLMTMCVYAEPLIGLIIGLSSGDHTQHALLTRLAIGLTQWPRNSILPPDGKAVTRVA